MKLVVNFDKRVNPSLQVAQEYVRRGWPVIPCSGKKPILTDWTKRTLEITELGSYFTGKENIGVRLDRITDIDLDSPEAIVLANSFLPPTVGVFGHGTEKAKSHMLYDSKAPSVKYTYRGKVLLEIRHGTGHQTVFPGSVHPTSGEKIVWAENRFNPTVKLPKVAPADLRAQCDKLAAGSLLLAHWNEGTRHDLSVAVQGIMLRGGMEQVEVEDFIANIARAAGDSQERVQSLYESLRLKKGEKVPGIPTLAKIIGEEGKDRFLEWMRLEKANSVVEELNRIYAFSAIGNTHRILAFEQDGKFANHHYSVESVASLHRNSKVKINGKLVNPIDYWMESPNRRTYKQGLVFDPGGAQYPDRFNLWQGFAVEPCTGDMKRYLDHMFEIVCAGDEGKYNWLCAWLADMVQRPLERPGTAVVLQGDEGVGKGALTRPWEKIYGMAHCVLLYNVKQLTGQFNWILKDKMLVLADEVIWGGDKREAGALRALITEPMLTIEPKGIDPFPMPVYFRLIMMTNSHWAVPAAMNSRRFFVVRVSGKRRGDMRYWERLAAVPPGAILRYFMEYEIPESVNLREALWTEELQEQRELSANPIQAWWLERLREGYVLHGVPWQSPVSCRQVRTACMNADKNNRSTETEFGMALRALCPGVRRMKKTIVAGHGQVGVYLFPSLEQCRRDYERLAADGRAMNWDK